ncbi:MAG: GtrA family protein [Gammaproteobacteria bacterium]|nr:GtrA family protein [Gammaproteobacteria bacterium]
MKKVFFTKAIRYGACSAAALVVDVGLMTLLIEIAGMPYLYAAAIGFTAGCTVAYVASTRFVFENRNTHSESTTAILFVLVGIGGLLLNQLVLYVGVDLLAVHYLLAKFVSAGLVFWFNFLVRGSLVFRDPDLWKTP